MSRKPHYDSDATVGIILALKVLLVIKTHFFMKITFFSNMQQVLRGRN